MFETAVASEVFGLDRVDMGVPSYRLVLCNPAAPILLATKDGGFSAYVEHDLRVLRRAEIIICPGWTQGFEVKVPSNVVDELRRAHKRGAWIASFCSGAHVLASTGLLDGRTAATHWMHAPALQQRHPLVRFDNEVLYVDDDSGLFTSAGTAAAIDLSLHMMRKRHGAEVANVIARRMVMPAHRMGGQAQFITNRPDLPTFTDPLADPLVDSLEWARKNLSTDIAVATLAKRAKMSPRTYARRFPELTGTTPLQWLLSQRVLDSQRLLERTGLSIERIANSVGLGTAANLRVHFGRIVGVSPAHYRRTFRTDVA